MKWLMTYPENREAVSAYTRWVETAGVEWVISRPGDASAPSPADFDAILLTGGGDINPKLYEEQSIHTETGGIDQARDRHETDLIDAFVAAAKPVFGICRGIQVISVNFGGKLIQHIPDYLQSIKISPDKELHRQLNTYNTFHYLNWLNQSRLATELDFVADTNSSHHQSVHPHFVGDGLRVSAMSPAGIVEAIESFESEAPILAVQWHPEQLPPSHAASAKLINYLKSLCGRGIG
ncbi:MAG: hypothetical protein C0404_06410 [Verrucomicrobia bacterium]|nr:hypothetical protein [Verrucomicrobiota bacterium]